MGLLQTIEPQPIDLKNGSNRAIDGALRRLHLLDKYPAKMIPQMAQFLIERSSEPGDTVLDPFCGSGTVVREALALRRNAIGLDVNPLAALFTRAKVGSYSKDLLEQQLAQLCGSFKTETTTFDLTFPNAEYWFTPATLRKLGNNPKHCRSPSSTNVKSLSRLLACCAGIHCAPVKQSRHSRSETLHFKASSRESERKTFRSVQAVCTCS